jgi:hypothetical protein
VPSLRCSTCGINFPLHFMRCRECGGPLWSNRDADPDWDEDAEPLVGAQRGDAEAWRFEQYERMGFTELQARALAATKDEAGFPLRWTVVETALQWAKSTQRDESEARDLVFDVYS